MVVLIKWFAAQFVKEGEFFFRGRLHSNSTEELLYKFKECQALHTLASFYVGISMISLTLFLGPFEFICKTRGHGSCRHWRIGWTRHVNRSWFALGLAGFRRFVANYCIEEWIVHTQSRASTDGMMATSSKV